MLEAVAVSLERVRPMAVSEVGRGMWGVRVARVRRCGVRIRDAMIPGMNMGGGRGRGSMG